LKSGATKAVLEATTMKSLRILVVENDVLIATLMGDMLEDMGHRVCATEATEADAIAAAARHNPDLMIVDLRLGDGSGLSAITEICRISPVPHLFVTGDMSLIAALRPDAVAVQKPFREADLAQAIRRALHGL
jgi:CheY-like chemotaxis protein